MNEKKMRQLFDAAKRATAPAPPADFAADVLRAVRQLPPEHRQASPSIFDQLNAWFPRVALAALALIVICVALDLNDPAATAAPGGTTAGDENNTTAPAQAFYNVDDV